MAGRGGAGAAAGGRGGSPAGLAELRRVSLLQAFLAPGVRLSHLKHE